MNGSSAVLKNGKHARAVREKFMHTLLLEGIIRSSSMEAAVDCLPLEAFLRREFELVKDEQEVRIAVHELQAERDCQRIYSGKPVLTYATKALGPVSVSSPLMTIMTLELMSIRAGMRVVEIGSGTGYGTALLAKLVGGDGHVLAMDCIADLANESAHVLYDLRMGNAEVVLDYAECLAGEMVDRIIVWPASTEVLPRLLESLGCSGRLIMPLIVQDLQLLLVVQRNDQQNEWLARIVGAPLTPMPPLLVQQDDNRGDVFAFVNLPRHLLRVANAIALEDGPLVGRRVLDFWFYVMAQGLDVSLYRLNALGVGIVFAARDDSWAVIARDKIFRGDGHAAFSTITRLYQRWRRLGSPRLADYRLRIYRSSSAGTASGFTLRLGQPVETATGYAYELVHPERAATPVSCAR